MALKNQLLSWLRSLKAGGSTEEQSAEELSAAESSEATAKAADTPDPALLDFPLEHAIHQLYDLRARQYGWAPLPRIYLDDPGVMPEGWLPKELERLRSGITTVAKSRLEKTKQKPPKPKNPQNPQNPQEIEEEPIALDAMPWIYNATNRLAAWMVVFPPVGEGLELSREMIDKCLKENEISFGIDEELLNSLLSNEERYLHSYLIARGVPATDGKDGSIVDFFSREIKQEIKTDEFGQVDYTALNLVQNVKEGDPICQLIPETEGIPGTTVQNKEIPAKNGKKVSLPKGRNTEVSEDGTKLIAAKPGHVEFSGRTFQVRPVLDIGGSVDYSTGNISFLGDVHIRGDVCTGFSVRAVGNVRVDGVVEGAIEAGGDLIVGRGILGSQQAIVRAHRNIFAKYMESSRVHARENLQTDCIVNCSVYSDGHVQVLSGRGTIIGGRVSAAHGVSAKIVGSKAESLTTISLGGLPCAEFERELLLRDIEELQESQKKLECQPDGPAKLSRLSKTRMQISVNKMKLDQMDKELEVLQAELEAKGKARLECGIAYPGTEIIIKDKSLKLTTETHKCVARLSDDGEIRLF